MNKKFLIPFFVLFVLVFISNVLALSGSLSPSRIEYTGDVGRVYLKTLTIKNTNNFQVDATVSTTGSNIILSQSRIVINANSNYSLPFNITIAKEGYDEQRINVMLKGTGIDFLDLSTVIALQGNSNNNTNTTVPVNNSTDSSDNTINPNATETNGTIFISATLDPATPSASPGKDLIINGNLKNLAENRTDYTITVNSYSDFSDLLILNPQVLTLNPNEDKNFLLHLYIKNNAQGNKVMNIRVDYGDSYEELSFYINILNNTSQNLTDIAYVVKNSFAPDDNFLNVINELGYNYNLISSSQVSNTDFSKYKMILLGDQRISGVPVNRYKSLFANPDYYTNWSSSKASTSKPTSYNSNQNISITKDLPINFNAYTNTGTTLYYLSKTKIGSKAVTTTGNSTVDLGHFSVATKESPRRVFFGITKSYYWSPESRQLFKNSIDWVILGEDKDNDSYFGDFDCNDANPNLYRTVKAYKDNDNDGFGTGNYTDVCIGNTLPAGYSYINGDCNDNNPNVNPNTLEIPYNGMDDDCNSYDLADVDLDGYCKTGYFVQNAFVQCLHDVIGIGTDCNDNDLTYNIGSNDIYKNCKNDAPNIDNIQKITVNEGETVLINIIANDPENNTLIYSINDTRFSKNKSVFSWLTGYNDAGNYVFKVNVSDGNLSNSSLVYVEIKDINRVATCEEIPNITWNENENLTIDLKTYCSDPDGNDLEYSIYQIGDENIIANINEEGIVQLSSTEYFNGNSWIKFTFNDGIDSSISQRYNLIVRLVNQAPIIVENLDSIILNEDTHSIDLMDLNDFFMDIDSNLTYSVTGNTNVGIVINDSIVSFYPTNAYVGNESVIFSATDGEFNINLSTILEVLYRRKAPRFNELNCTTTLIEDTPYSCELSATDPENDSFNFSVVRNNNLNCSIVGNTLNYIGFEDHNGTATCGLRVRDNDGYNDLVFNASIENFNDPPYFYSYSPGNSTKIFNNTLKEFTIVPRDVDSSNLNVTWTLDNETVGTGNSYGFRKTIGNYNLLAILSDGEFNISNIWNIYVADYNDFSCSEVNGHLCSEKQTCNGNILSVYDSPQSCCSIQCSDKPPVFENIKRESNISSVVKLELRNPTNSTQFNTNDEILVDIKVTNEADEKIDFNVYVYLYDLTKENVVEKATDSFKLSNSDSKTDILKLIVPRKVKESDEFYVFVKLLGQGKETSYYNEKYVKVIIKRKEYDIVVENVEITPKEALCGDNIQVNVKLRNYGTKEQDTTIRIESPLIGTSKEKQITLQSFGDFEDEDISNDYIDLKINDNSKAGEYNIKALAIYNGLVNTNGVSVVLGECKKLDTDIKPIVNQNVTSVKLESKVNNTNNKLSKQMIVLVLFTTMLITFFLVLMMMKAYSRNMTMKNERIRILHIKKKIDVKKKRR